MRNHFLFLADVVGRKIGSLLLGGCVLVSTLSISAQTLPEELAEAEAFALGYQAYVLGAVYARSQILMEKDTHPNASLNAPLNVFNIYPGLATPDSAIDFTPNNDTVYGLAWLDLKQGPILITVPEVHDRYYTVQATDWALNTFSYIGSRINSKAGTYAYVPPNWQGNLPGGVIGRIEAPTTGVFLQARTVVQPEVEEDIGPVVAQLKTYKLKPLDTGNVYPKMEEGSEVPNPKLNNTIWKSLNFFTLLNRAWTFGGVREQDKELVKLFAPLGIGPNLVFSPDRLTEGQRRGLSDAVHAAYARVIFHARENGEVRNGWRYATNLGAYGGNHLLASTVSMVGYGANTAEEAMYLPVFTDDKDEMFSGEGQYSIHFAADNLPPADAFWSITLYSLPENQLRSNPLNRYAIGDRTPNLKVSMDGSIKIVIQENEPESGDVGNWLPSGGAGPFWMILRIYQPKEDALLGEFVPPPVRRDAAK